MESTAYTNAVSYQLAPLLKHPSIPINVKAKLINAIFLPTLTYQCQTWSLNKTLERKLVTCEMRCLRKAVNKTRRDKIRNEDIRAMVGATSVLQHIEQQRVKWFGHLTRMSPKQPALRAYNTLAGEEDREGDGVTPWLTLLGLTGCRFYKPLAWQPTDI